MSRSSSFPQAVVNNWLMGSETDIWITHHLIIEYISDYKGNYYFAQSTFPDFNPFSANPTKWSNTQTIRRKYADELFECVWLFCEIGA